MCFLDSSWDALTRVDSDPITGTKIHVCALCDQQFKRRDNLKNHVEAIHLGAQYRCKFVGCDKVCGSAPALRGHVRTYHENQLC